MGGCQNYGPSLGTLKKGIIGTILGLYGDKKMETTIFGLHIPS